jgi:hypothetical protein
MRVKFLFLSTFAIAVMMIYSCKKKDTSEPVITFSSPYSGQTFTVGQSIKVTATITFNSSLQFVKMNMVNSNYVAIDITQSLTVTGSPMNINTTYTMTNTSLPSGIYYLQISAYDGTNLAIGYQEIMLNALPLKREAIYVVTGSNSANTKVWKLDSANTISQVIALTGDFSNAAISSADQSLFTTGIYSGNFNCINLNTNTFSWNVPATNNGFPTFERVYSNDSKNFLAKYDNVINGFDNAGNINYTANTASGTYPHTLFSDSQYLYAEQRNISGYGVALNVYYLATGAAFQNIVINQDIVAMFSINSDSLMIFTNNNGIGNVMIYDIPDNRTTVPVTLPSEKIFSVTQISTIYYLIGMQNQVYIFNTRNFGSLNPFATVAAASAMKFDSLNQQIFVANAKNLNVYNFPTDTLYKTFNFTDTLKDISILYNR